MATPLYVRIGRIQYTLIEEPHKEHSPVLFIYLSQNATRTLIRRPLTPPKGELAQLELEFETVEHDESPEPPIMSLAERVQHANLNFDVFVQLRNSRGETGMNQAGSAKIAVYELLANPYGSHRLQLTVPSYNDPNAKGVNRDREVNNDKGFLELSGGIQFMLGSKPVMPLSARLVAFVKENEAKQEEDLRYYLGSTVALCKGLGYRWQVIKDINAYVHTNAL